MSKLTDYFHGEFVEMIVRGVSVNMGAEGQASLNFGGYIVDEDELYYYLGEEASAVIYSAVKKADVVAIMISEPNDEFSKFDIDDTGIRQ